MIEDLRSNPNENCLDGMACPKCQGYGPFNICVEVFVTVADDGVQDNSGDYEWEPESYCRCSACDYSATVADFNET